MAINTITVVGKEFRTEKNAQSFCTEKNRRSHKYAYVVKRISGLPGYHVIGIPKGRR